MTRKHNVDEVKRSLSKKGVLFGPGTYKLNSINELGKITSSEKVLSYNHVAVNNAHDLGNSSWGKLDYLQNYEGFSVIGKSVYKIVNS